MRTTDQRHGPLSQYSNSLEESAMSKFDSHSYNQGARSATPLESKNMSWWLRGKDILLAIRSKAARDELLGCYKSLQIRPFRSKRLGCHPIGVLLVVPIAGLIFGYVTRPSLARSGAGSPAGISWTVPLADRHRSLLPENRCTPPCSRPRPPRYRRSPHPPLPEIPLPRCLPLPRQMRQ